MTPRVLILAGLYDFSADLVTLQLEAASVPYIRLNREQLADYRITLDPIVPTVTVRGPNGICTIGQELEAIWFRQPVFLRNTPATPLTPAAQLERSQWSAFLRSLSVFRDAAWMNSPVATYQAESKPYQLSVAHRCGFQIPQTLVSNDAARLRRTFPESLVIKSLDTVLLRDGDDCLFAYTTMGSASLLHDTTVRAAPLLAQQELTDKTDLRVTVIGDCVFSVRILSHGRGIPGDWRMLPKVDLDYEDVALSASIVQCCRDLVETLGLNFAAIDLLDTPSGTYFLEVNPTGEWGWLSSAERPIHRSIAAWLASPPTYRVRQ